MAAARHVAHSVFEGSGRHSASPSRAASMKIALFGKNGQVGHELTGLLPKSGELLAVGRPDLDLSDRQSLRDWLREFKPDWIINAAAYTAVDRAEIEPALARSINAIAPGVMAEEARRTGALLVHYSTDYVF